MVFAILHIPKAKVRFGQRLRNRFLKILEGRPSKIIKYRCPNYPRLNRRDGTGNLLKLREKWQNYTPVLIEIL